MATVPGRTVLFKTGDKYFIQYLTGRAPKAVRAFYGATFEEYQEGVLHFTSPRGNPIEFEPEMLVNAL